MIDNSGFISLHRKIINWEWYQDLNTKCVFIHLVLLANHKDNKWRGITIQRGQHITSQDNLAKELGLKRQQIRTALNKLKSTNEITTESTSNYTLITVVKYDTYQFMDNGLTSESTNELTNEQPTSNQRVTTNNNDNNDNNDNKKNKRAKHKNSSQEEVDEKDKVSSTKLKVEEVKLFVDKRLYPTINSYVGEKELAFLVELYNKTEKTPYNKPTWLRDVSWIELIPLGLEVGIFAENLVKLANSFYPKYQSGYTVRDKRKIKNFYQFFSGIVRKEQINYRNRYDWFTWNVPPV